MCLICHSTLLVSLRCPNVVELYGFVETGCEFIDSQGRVLATATKCECSQGVN